MGCKQLPVPLPHYAPDDGIQQHGGAAALIYVKRSPAARVPEIKEKNFGILPMVDWGGLHV
jgi:hypothetical protein